MTTKSAIVMYRKNASSHYHPCSTDAVTNNTSPCICRTQLWADDSANWKYHSLKHHDGLARSLLDSDGTTYKFVAEAWPCCVNRMEHGVTFRHAAWRQACPRNSSPCSLSVCSEAQPRTSAATSVYIVVIFKGFLKVLVECQWHDWAGAVLQHAVCQRTRFETNVRSFGKGRGGMEKSQVRASAALGMVRTCSRLRGQQSLCVGLQLQIAPGNLGRSSLVLLTMNRQE